MNVPARKVVKQPPPPLATLEDLLAIPEEDRRHELIEGVLYPTKEATTGEHGAAQWAIASWTTPFSRRPGGRYPGGWWFATEVEILFDAKNTFKPDVAGWRRDRVSERPSGIPIRIRPDWVCEILSSNRAHDLVRKKRVYHRYEVTHYWIVDPLEQTLSVLRWSADGYIEVQNGARDEIVYPEPFEVMPLQVKILFGDDPDEDDESSEAAEEPKDESTSEG